MKRDYARYSTDQLKEERDNLNASYRHWDQTRVTAQEIMQSRLKMLFEVDEILRQRGVKSVQLPFMPGHTNDNSH